jgi:hypothetical protein
VDISCSDFTINKKELLSPPPHQNNNNNNNNNNNKQIQSDSQKKTMAGAMQLSRG